MSNKYTVKVIQQGQTQKIHALTGGAGMSGQALVLTAENGSRYQLTELVTQISPSKLQMKRVGKHLHVALPGGDLDAPDLVVEGFFEVNQASIWGSHETGEWMTYKTADLPDANAPAEPAGPLQTLFGKNNMVELSVPDTAPVTKALTYLETPKGLGTVLLGAAGLVVLAKALDSDADSATPTGAEAVLVNYAKDQNSTAPTFQDYSDFGIKAYASLSNVSNRVPIGDTSVLGSDGLGITASAWLGAINSALGLLGPGKVSKSEIQKAVDSYYRILKEADGNATTDTDVYVDLSMQDEKGRLLDVVALDDPRAEDYANIGVSVGSTTKALDLLNDVVGRSSKSVVDTAAEINDLARASENVMLLAKGATTAANAGPSLYIEGEWVTGINLLLGQGASSAVRGTNVSAIKNAIAHSKDDGTAVDTVTELQEIVTAYTKILTEANGALEDAQLADPVGADYLTVGVGQGTSQDAAILQMLNVTAYAGLLTDVVANKNTVDVDAVSELNALALIVTKVRDLEAKATGDTSYADITGGVLQVSELANLGLSTSLLTDTDVSSAVHTNRLNAVYSSIIGAADTSAIDTIAELQTLITNTSVILS